MGHLHGNIVESIYTHGNIVESIYTHVKKRLIETRVTQKN